MTMTPRWWQHGVEDWLAELDAAWRDAKRSGPLTLEVHYRSGAPLLVKVRELQMPPPSMEFRIVTSAASSW